MTGAARPRAERRNPAGDDPAARFRRLFRVRVTHDYYARHDGRCPALRATPTEATAKVLRSLGLVFSDEGDGFSVFFRSADLPAILRYIENGAAARRADGEGSGYWSRLSFRLDLADPAFVAVTALPLDIRLAERNLYGSNLYAHRPDREATDADDAALLSEGRFMDAAALRPVVIGEVDVTVAGAPATVEVRDLSGAVVLRWPDPPAPARASSGDGIADAPPQRVTLDFGALAHGLYTIVMPAGAREVLYLPPGARSVALLDMLLTRPSPDRGGVYPIPPLHRGGEPPAPEECGGIDYRLPFAARATYWHYLVVSRVPGARLSDLAVEGRDAVFTPAARPVPLPDGSTATLFAADTALPLRDKSDRRFRLSGRRREPGGHEAAVVVARLPVAPALPVGPGPGDDPDTGTSEMFVYV